MVNFQVKDEAAAVGGVSPLEQEGKPAKKQDFQGNPPELNNQPSHTRTPSGNPILVNRWSQDTESLLIFNPRDEAVRDSHPYFGNPMSTLLMSQSQPNKFKEALDTLYQENLYLRDQIKDQQNIMQIQKAMLGELLESVKGHTQGLKATQIELFHEINSQTEYLRKSAFENHLDTSQISFMTTALDIEVNDSPNKKGACSKCSLHLEQERQQFKAKQGALMRELEQLRAEMA